MRRTLPGRPIRLVLLSLVLSLVAAMALIADARPGHAEGTEPAFMQRVFPPELVMKNAREIGLRDTQRQAISQAIQRTQAATLELQWGMQDAAADLSREMEGEKIDEKKALAAAERVMAIEGQIKRAHLRLLIEIKNELDPEQQSRLATIRAKANPS